MPDPSNNDVTLETERTERSFIKSNIEIIDIIPDAVYGDDRTKLSKSH